MECPRCKQAELSLDRECPQCGFHGDVALLEELSHIDWLLNDLSKWKGLGISSTLISQIKVYYSNRRKKLEIDLGLRPPPLTPTEAQAAWHEFLQHIALFERIRIWVESGQARDVALPAYTKRADELRRRLEGYTRPKYPQTRQERLDVVKFILNALPALKEAEAFKFEETEQKISAALLAEKEQLETLLGIRPKPQPQTKAPTAAPVRPATVSTPPHPAIPQQPISERLWRSVFSERTLQALIFLGIFLLFTAAISFVISGWKDFPGPVRVGLPTIFTVIFLLLGLLVRAKTSLYRSSIALSAIAALFVPIDFYTVYANYGSLGTWQQFWVVASIFSFMFYFLMALPIQSRFFGYLVAIAMGSCILSLIEISGVSRDWYAAGLSAQAVGMLFTAAGLTRPNVAARLRVFIEPFRYMALWVPAILMPLTFGVWWVIRGFAFDDLQNATTITWFLGAFIFGWGAIRHRSVALGRLAVLSLPVAVFIGQTALFHQFNINNAWHAFGLACLTPLYFFTSYKLSQKKDDPVLSAHASAANVCGWLLVVIAAILSLLDLTSGAPAAATYAVLTGSVAMSAVLRQRPAMLYLVSLFSAATSAFTMTELHAGLSQLGVGWASLALLHILLALWLGRTRLASPHLG